MELRSLPASLGFGFYISDSEESVDSTVREWLAHGCPEDFLVKSQQTDASTVYQSAKESSLEDDSDFDWDSFSELDTPVKRTQFPASPGKKEHLDRCISQSREITVIPKLDHNGVIFLIQKQLFNTKVMFDAKLEQLEEKRKRRTLEIENNFVAKLTSLKLMKHEDSTLVNDSPDQSPKSTAKQPATVPAQLTKPSKEAAKQPVTHSSDVQNPAREAVKQPATVPVQLAKPSKEAAQQPVTHSANVRTLSKKAAKQPETVAKLVLTSMKQVKPSEESMPGCSVTGPKVVELYPAPNLVTMSETMKVPSSHPPPATLFSLDSEDPNLVINEYKIAFHASRNAVEFEAYHKHLAQELISTMGDFGTNIANRSICKKIDKQMKIDVQQISAVEQQVRVKITRILSVFKKLEGSAAVIYGYAQFSRYLINRCAGIQDNMVFAVARVAVGVIDQHPKLLSLLLSFLHEVSVLTVPKYYSTTNRSLRGTLLDKLGFRDISGPEEDRKETNDEFINRQSGYVKFYAAFIELNGDLHGLKFGWSYLSRMLNNLPPSRITASALMAFLKIAGYSLFKTYRRQFFKVLLYVHSTFLVRLANDEDDEAKAVYMRLQTYLQNQDFLKQPQFKALKLQSESQNVFA
eukprot:g718.t1